MTEHTVGEIPVHESNPWGLTSNDQAMLELVAKGHTHAEIAKELGYSVHTIHNRLRKIRLDLEEKRIIPHLPDSDGLAQAYKYMYSRANIDE